MNAIRGHPFIFFIWLFQEGAAPNTRLRQSLSGRLITSSVISVVEHLFTQRKHFVAHIVITNPI
jgi:hypothetical protein